MYGINTHTHTQTHTMSLQLTVSIQQTIIYEIFIFMRFLLEFMVLSWKIGRESKCTKAKICRFSATHSTFSTWRAFLFLHNKIATLKTAYNQRFSVSRSFGLCMRAYTKKAQYIGANMFMQMHFNRKTYLNRSP